ncbi:sce7726 family protein [Runella sp.]|uniref:sce7726 family protein n=1 Tax=Runella sp. TaxID=1960881 RepID=UPI003D0A94AB
MRDIDIRSALHNQFLMDYRLDGISRIVDELHICGGNTIADLAVINGSLHAFEIKSSVDTLQRLRLQSDSYIKVFDYITIVVNGNHLNKVMDTMPDWFGIWLIEDEGDEVRRTIIRPARKNGSIDAFSVAQLLWKDEAIEILLQEGHSKKIKTMRKWLLWEYMAQNIPTDRLSELVRLKLKQRQNWKESGFSKGIEPSK